MMPFMMSPDKKIATMIVSKPDTKEVSDNETDYSAGYEAACKDIMSAFEKKDEKLLLAGLKDLMTMFMDEHESGPKEEAESEEEDKE
jgi:hypothetical protein